MLEKLLEQFMAQQEMRDDHEKGVEAARKGLLTWSMDDLWICLKCIDGTEIRAHTKYKLIKVEGAVHFGMVNYFNMEVNKKYSEFQKQENGGIVVEEGTAVHTVPRDKMN